MKKIFWQRIWARKYAPFISEAFISIFQKKTSFAKCKNKLFLPEGNLYAIYFSQDEFFNLVKKYTNFLLKQDLKKYAKQYEDKFREFLSWARQMAKIDYASATNRQIINLLQECSDKTLNSGEQQFLSFVVLEGAGRELESILSKQENGGKILEWISTPPQETKITKIRLELLKMLIRGKIGDKEITDYARRYAWVPVYEFIDRPWTIQDIKEQIAHIFDPAKELLEYQKNRKNNLTNYQKYFKSLPTGRFKKLVEILHYFSYLKEMRDDYRRQAYYHLRPLWLEVAKRTNLSFEETNYLITKELIAAINHPSEKYQKIARARMKKYSLVLKNGKLSACESDLSAKYLMDKNTKQRITEIKGVVANRGITKGRVKIIFHQGEFSKFKTGDVLITTMTHPEFLVIMKKASAIVTDEGGITCHAAIVTREMNKPCIIGTKIATQIFKDGDLVEVDANSGKVVKLNKI